MAKRVGKGRKIVEGGVRLGDFNIPQSAPIDDSHSLRDRAMLVRLQVGCWQGTGKDTEGEAQLRKLYGGKGRYGTVTKHKMDRKVLADVLRLHREGRRFHKENTLPWGDTGARLLAASNFLDYKKRMAAFEREYWLSVTKYVEEYERNVREQKARLGSAWRASDYPPVEQVQNEFKWLVTVEPIPTSDDFRLTLSGDEAEQIKRAYDDAIKQRMREGVQEVFQNVEETVNALKERLRDPDAKVRSNTFGALKKLVATLPVLNDIVKDPAITELGKRIAQDLLDVDVDAVAHDKSERRKVAKRADDLLAALKPLQQNWIGGSTFTVENGVVVETVDAEVVA